ncbi:MAG: RsmD family RNA methyltransferase [Leptospiraceae bacterium]|nr:RsmD family RNA methyltransferase [Leptospiraceae bacterium]MCP5498648.1 RsmD family RNA methyltransferase [Leptospiraceae bacterium]
MQKLKVLSGSLKGRVLSTPPAIKGNQNFTPSLIKEAVFSILDSLEMEGKLNKQTSVFVDLFAASGQMGLEAFSRGFSRSVLFELSSERFRVLKKNMQDIAPDLEVYHRDAFRFYKEINCENVETLVYFLDLPYSFWNGSSKEKIYKLTENILNSSLPGKKMLILQAGENPNWENFEVKRYRNNYLLIKTDATFT